MRRFSMAVLACSALSAALLFGQAPPPATQVPAAATAPAGDVIGVGNFIHVVGNIDKSLQFYHDVLGMDLAQAGGGRGGRGGAAAAPGAGNAGAPPTPAAAAPPGAPPALNGPRPFVTTPEVLHLYNSAGAQYRNTTVGVMEFPMRAELAEFEDADKKPIQPRFQDPGASYFILTVRDLDPILARAKASDVATVISKGGQPISMDTSMGKARGIILRDPDNFYVVIAQPEQAPQTSAPPERNIIGMSFGFTVGDLDAMVNLFNKTLGFSLQSDPNFYADKDSANLSGVPGVQVRKARGLVPGTSFGIVFTQFKGTDTKAVHSDPKDPGSPVFRLRVKDLDSILKSLSAAGVTVASAGGQPVAIGNAQRFAITRGPDNLFIQVVGAAAPPAAAPAGAQ